MHAGTSGLAGDKRRIYRCSTITTHAGRRHKPTVAISAGHVEDLVERIYLDAFGHAEFVLLEEEPAEYIRVVERLHSAG
jgi:hypothetical protein